LFDDDEELSLSLHPPNTRNIGIVAVVVVVVVVVVLFVGDT